MTSLAKVKIPLTMMSRSHITNAPGNFDEISRASQAITYNLNDWYFPGVKLQHLVKCCL